MAKDTDPFYKQPIFWILISGPFIVVIMAFFTFGLAQSNASDLVTDDYYKDGKHINLQLERDIAATKRHILAQVLISPEMNMAKVLISGDFDDKAQIYLKLMHPAKKALDQNILLTSNSDSIPASGIEINHQDNQNIKREYLAKFDKLPNAIHWYIRVEDGNGIWRVEEKWLPSQGFSVELKPNELAIQANQASQTNQASQASQAQ